MTQMVKYLPSVWKTQLQSQGWEDALQKGRANSLQCSCLENSMDRGAWWVAVQGIAESDTTE